MALSTIHTTMLQAVRRLTVAPAARSLSTAAPAVLPDLDYDYSELEPVISGEIMSLHHSKHHNTYVTNYNVAMEKFLDAQAKGDVATMVALQPALRQPTVPRSRLGAGARPRGVCMR